MAILGQWYYMAILGQLCHEQLPLPFQCMYTRGQAEFPVTSLTYYGHIKSMMYDHPCPLVYIQRQVVNAPSISYRYWQLPSRFSWTWLWTESKVIPTQDALDRIANPLAGKQLPNIYNFSCNKHFALSSTLIMFFFYNWFALFFPQNSENSTKLQIREYLM